ncbi:uncharacterized protein F5891DRAFT_986041 [Suillus fuscotomentosus]|uniref:Uncharacterized protein n=1 Tax=Suillus fuscotomentosus TaxID=1912939 RepID=A0AAD4HD74_9AGAM|nr:uncharacterized protein F5891DRAFT_986041 [Suillus fuscotomentosus]KAG1893295.1 hypothetical protein F5891DRAFT_986041 [Suillus fuscotomentosus]
MMRSPQAVAVHTQLSTPPSSVGQSSHEPDSSDESPQIIVRAPPSSPPDPTPYRSKRRSRTVARSVRSRNHRRSPPSSDTSPDSDSHELFAFPRPPSDIMERLPSLAGRAQRKFRPYGKPHGFVPNALELRFFRRCLESGDNDMSLADIQAGKDILQDCLKRLSKKALTQAVAAKEADCESKRMAVLGTAWAVEAKDRYQALLEMIVEEEVERYTISSKEATFLRTFLVGCSREDLEVAKDFDVGAHSHNSRSFAVADLTLSHIEGVNTVMSSSPEDDFVDEYDAMESNG